MKKMRKLSLVLLTSNQTARGSKLELHPIKWHI